MYAGGLSFLIRRMHFIYCQLPSLRASQCIFRPFAGWRLLPSKAPEGRLPQRSGRHRAGSTVQTARAMEIEASKPCLGACQLDNLLACLLANPLAKPFSHPGLPPARYPPLRSLDARVSLP